MLKIQFNYSAVQTFVDQFIHISHFNLGLVTYFWTRLWLICSFHWRWCESKLMFVIFSQISRFIRIEEVQSTKPIACKSFMTYSNVVFKSKVILRTQAVRRAVRAKYPRNTGSSLKVQQNYMVIAFSGVK